MPNDERHCASCGSLVPEGHHYCPGCGTRVDGEDSWIVRGIAALGTGLVVLVGGVFGSCCVLFGILGIANGGGFLMSVAWLAVGIVVLVGVVQVVRRRK